LKKVFGKVKTVAKKSVKFAKKIAKNRLVKSTWNSLKRSMPSPANLYLMAAEEAVKLGKNIASASKPVRTKAKQAKKLAHAVANKKITASAARVIAKKKGLSEKQVIGAAGFFRGLKNKNKKAIAAARVANKLHKLEQKGDYAAIKSTGTEAAIRAQHPNARAYVVKGPSGRSYRSVVVPVE
jgi:hypothetical protein